MLLPFNKNSHSYNLKDKLEKKSTTNHLNMEKEVAESASDKRHYIKWKYLKLVRVT